MISHRIELVPLDKIEESPVNPKNHDEAGIAESIEEHGLAELPMIDDRTGWLEAGHGRIRYLRQRHQAGQAPPDGVEALPDGTWLVPVIRGWASRDAHQAARYLVASNQLTITGGWHADQLAEMLTQLQETEPGLLGTGYTPLDLDALLEEIRTTTVHEHQRELPGDPDDIPEPPADPITKRGDIWLLGPHRLMCGDSTNPHDVHQALDGRTVELVFTDPPYGIAYQAVKGSAPIEGDGDLATAEDILERSLTLTPAPAAFVCCNWRCLGSTAAAMDRAGFPPKTDIVWDKQHGVQNLDRYARSHELILYAGPFGGQPTFSTDVWTVPRETIPGHPTPKPVDLIARAITSASEKGALVYDGFAGSGSTLIAAELTERVAVVIEKDPAYCDVVAARFERATGIVPIHQPA